MRFTRSTASTQCHRRSTQLLDQVEVQPTTKIFLESFVHAPIHYQAHAHPPLPLTRVKLFSFRRQTSRTPQAQDPALEQLQAPDNISIRGATITSFASM